MTALRIPCPDQRDTRGPNYAGLYVFERRRLVEARSLHRVQAAAARLAHYIARRSARADGYTPVELRRLHEIPRSDTDNVWLRAEITTTTPP